MKKKIMTNQMMMLVKKKINLLIQKRAPIGALFCSYIF
jgi:hypothetical protein